METSKILMVIAQKDFRDEEYLQPLTIFKEHGLRVMTASERKGECQGKLGAKVWADLAIEDVNQADFEAIVFVGGSGAANFVHQEEVLLLVKDFFADGKIVAAICIAPRILASAGILTGKKVTAFETEQADLAEKGAIFTGARVEIDSNIITADGPDSAEEFAEAILKALE